MLLIEKVVKLLDDFHYDILHDYVKNISLRSYYPLALIDVIDRNPQREQLSEQLYWNTYGEDPSGEKDMKKFFQLAHYTFKLTGYLAKNYPAYLQHNITGIQHLINTGKLEEATHLAEILLDVSEKIEDHDTTIKVLNILAMREVLLESAKQSIRFFEKIEYFGQLREDVNSVSQYIFQNFGSKGKASESEQIDPHLAFFESYNTNESFVVRMLAKYGYYLSLYYFRNEQFYQKQTFTAIQIIIDQLQKHNYIIFPFMHRLLPKLVYFKLNCLFRQLDEQVIFAETSKILEDSKDTLFWNSFINQAEVNSITIQTSFFISHYMHSYRSDHLSLIPKEVLDQIDQLRERCSSLLANPTLESDFIIRYINITTAYAGLLILGNLNQIKEGIDQLNKLLVFYQQVPFHMSIDTVYVVLIVGYFCLKNYDKVEDSYRRYRKATKGKVVNPENDLTIHGFYYTTKWITTGRNQYCKKIGALVKETMDKKSSKSTYNILQQLITYYNIPVGDVDKVRTLD